MADEDDPRRSSPYGAAASFALNAAAGTVPDEDMRAFVHEQTRLAAMQSQNLIEQNSFELSHLRWQRFNDQMKGAMQIMLVAVGALIVVAIGAAIWAAAHDDSLVIDAFKMPPDMAAQGLTGDVVASQLLDHLTQMQAQTDSSRAPDTYANDWASGIKVYIPDTGLSVGDASRSQSSMPAVHCTGSHGISVAWDWASAAINCAAIGAGGCADTVWAMRSTNAASSGA
jgi:hypothetical protein